MPQLTTPGRFCKVDTPVTGQMGPSKYWAPSMRITETLTTFWFPTLSLQVWGARLSALRQVTGALGASPAPRQGQEGVQGAGSRVSPWKHV